MDSRHLRRLEYGMLTPKEKLKIEVNKLIDAGENFFVSFLSDKIIVEWTCNGKL